MRHASKRVLFAMCLFTAPLAHATLYNWTGSLNGGSDSVSGTFDLDYSAPLNPDVSFCNQHYGGLSGLSLTIGPRIYNRLSAYHFDTPFENPDGSQFWFVDAPMDGEWADFSFINTGENPGWYIQFTDATGHLKEMSGKILSLYKDAYFPQGEPVDGIPPSRDADPVPEPSSFLLLGSAFLGMGAFRRFRQTHPQKNPR